MTSMIEEAVAAERARCIAICESWIGTWQDVSPKHVPASTWAVDGINDIIDLIRDGTDISALKEQP